MIKRFKHGTSVSIFTGLTRKTGKRIRFNFCFLFLTKKERREKTDRKSYFSSRAFSYKGNKWENDEEIYFFFILIFFFLSWRKRKWNKKENFESPFLISFPLWRKKKKKPFQFLFPLLSENERRAKKDRHSFLPSRYSFPYEKGRKVIIFSFFFIFKRKKGAKCFRSLTHLTHHFHFNWIFLKKMSVVKKENKREERSE